MDRLEIRQIHPASIPGLLPMGLGAAMALCAMLLVLSAGRNAASNNTGNDLSSVQIESEAHGSFRNLLVSAVLTVGYGAGLVGTVPFVAATTIFIFLFSVYFLWPGNQSNLMKRLRICALCAIYAVAFAAGIAALFRYGFLVRLP